MTHVRVLVVDDHHLARRAVRAILAEDERFEIVGEATSAQTALDAANRLQPDLVLMDIRLPGNGLDATRRIKASHPQVKVVMITVSDDAQDLFEAIRNGAQGYLLKNLAPEEWTGYLRGIMDGDTPISRSLAARILRELSGGAEPHTASLDKTLTEREMEVLQQVAQGCTNKEAAQALHISENTVKNHLKSILSKLRLKNRSQLTRFAVERGVIRE